MSKFPETRALAEQALRHILDEQAKLLKRKDASALVEIVSSLNQLAVKTSKLLVEGFNRSQSLAKFTEEARTIEVLTDRISEELWISIPVSISGIYKNLEESVVPPQGYLGLAAETRAHYHNLRLRLLGQLLGARMLAMNSDLGEETERVWIQFLDRHLGPSLRVLRGGHICDHRGNKSSQIDLIVVGSDAQVLMPADSHDGKAHVLIDQVVAAVMVTSNLTAEKLKKDWENLQSIPSYVDLEKDYPNFKNHPWPLTYIVGAQSDPIDLLKSAWQSMCKAGLTKVVPQFVITLDDGYIYGGLRRWPCPRYPGNYTAADQINDETGIYAGLGLGWFILQQQGRIASIQKRVVEPISRFAEVLNNASLKKGVPPTWSKRFDTSFLPREIGGAFEWGRISYFAHNRLYVMALSRSLTNEHTIYDYLYIDGVDGASLKYEEHSKFLRWFRYPAARKKGRILAVEEWENLLTKEAHARKIAVFDMISGNEIKSPFVDGLTDLPNMEELEEHVRQYIPEDGRSLEEVKDSATLDRADFLEALRARNLFQ